MTLLYLPFGLTGPLLIDHARLGGRLSDWLLVALTGQAALMAVFATGRWVVHRRSGGVSHPWATVAVIVVAIIVRAWMVAWVVTLVGLSDDFELAYRIGSSLVAQLGVLIVFAIVVSSQREHRELSRLLSGQRRAYAELNRTMAARLDETLMRLRAEVRRTIDPLILKINSELDELAETDDAGPVHSSFRRMVDDDLRPLSHRLVDTFDVEEAVEVSDASYEVSEVPFPPRMTMNRLLQPVAFGLLIILISTSQALREFPPPSVLTFPLISGVLVMGIMAILRRIVGPLSVPSWVGVIAAGLLSGVVVLAAMLAQRAAGLAIPSFIDVAAGVVGVIVGVLIAIYVIADQRRTDVESSLRESIQQLQNVSSILRQHAFVARRHLSYVIHGSIQSALHAAAMRLALVDRRDADLIAEIRHDIATAMSKLDEPVSSYVLLIDTLTEISDLWEGTCHVTWTMDHRTIRAIAESPVAAASIAEIIRECVTNSARHGSATKVALTLIRGEGRVIMTVTDDGRGLSPDAPSGLGSRMLDEMCLAWHRDSDSAGTTVVAEVSTVAVAPA